MVSTYVAGSPLDGTAAAVEGSFVDLEGGRFYRIANYESMPPFFMSLVSDSDHWMFLSSNGALTVGRKDPDHALFPYYTDDRIHDSQDQTGAKTLLRVRREAETCLWEPFSPRYDGFYRVVRNLYKSVYGNKIIFEERNLDLGLTFRYAWMNSDRFGFVRRSTLRNDGDRAVALELVDGIQNVLPYGVERRFQNEFSTLVDGYKRTERVGATSLALFRLSSIPVDKAEPSEALRVNLAWSTGLEPARHLLSSAQLPAFRRGSALQGETDLRGQRGAYFLNATLALEPGARKDWLLVAEVSQDAKAVHALLRRLDAPSLGAEVLDDVERGTRNLVRIVASADGLQTTRDELSTWRHFSNTLFNVMRGGLPHDGYRVSRADFTAFLTQANRELAAASGGFLEALPETLAHGELLQRVARQGDPDLDRLASEYLPLTFSRRHGDPSRPWNTFCIRVKDRRGDSLLDYQGNWRDIFQNWEALGHSFPGYLESMIFKFADATTADGYNPYRIMRDGFEWEAIDPRDPWSFIGYWGDHQVIYLLKLLEASSRYHPGALLELMDKRVFTYANVPYRIKPYEAMLANPRSTITFDREAHQRTLALSGRIGADGLALMGPWGPARANLTEKLLVVALSKLSNFIPEAGIWMNTQRPEWNDANNALVGYGVSMVTLFYLRRYLAFCRELFPTAGSGSLEVAQEIAEFLEGVAAVFEGNVSLLGKPITDRDRKRVLDALGTAGTAYREKIYARGFGGEVVKVPAERLASFCAVALLHIDHAIRVNRRQDGLYHAYNLMKATGDGLEIRHLCEMLEGQVAVLSSGALAGPEAAALLDALRASSLYREDQASYILYPDRPLPHFLDKNRIPAQAVRRSELLMALLDVGDERIVNRDVEGTAHFNPDLRNGDKLRAALEALKAGEYRSLVEKEGQQVLDLYEAVFDHQSFTGRSGTFYKYEGLGCVYWHMVSKLLLAVDEIQKGPTRGDAATVERLKAHYHEIREGLGVHKTPARYGAIPTDPYSHTPGFAGVQQPGMTGQVKEDLLTRLSEMGVQVSAGRLAFLPWMVAQSEFLDQPASFPCLDTQGRFRTLELIPDSLAFTFCQVPVVLHRAGPRRVAVAFQDGSSKVTEGLELEAATSEAIFERTGQVVQLDVHLGLVG